MNKNEETGNATKKECKPSPRCSDTCGGKEIGTPSGLAGNIADWHPALDQTLDEVLNDFAYDAESSHVPTGLAILKMATLMEALDWHLYAVGDITMGYAREQIKWAAELMDKKFDIEYERLPQ